MNDIVALVSLAAIFLALIVSPGPNFLVITQIAVKESRLHAICTGLGVATGSVLWALAAALGLSLLFSDFPIAQKIVQIFGGAYLIYVGSKIWRGAQRPLGQRSVDGSVSASFFSSYRFGLATNLTNPKALVFYSSVFTSLLAPGLSAWTKPAAVLVIAVLASSWFITLATIFSIEPVQNAYRRAKAQIDRITGSCLVLFGIKLACTMLAFR